MNSSPTCLPSQRRWSGGRSGRLCGRGSCGATPTSRCLSPSGRHDADAVELQGYSDDVWDWPKIRCAAPRGLQGVQGKEDDGGECVLSRGKTTQNWASRGTRMQQSILGQSLCSDASGPDVVGRQPAALAPRREWMVCLRVGQSDGIVSGMQWWGGQCFVSWVRDGPWRRWGCRCSSYRRVAVTKATAAAEDPLRPRPKLGRRARIRRQPRAKAVRSPVATRSSRSASAAAKASSPRRTS
ncbi:MAG: hypothetical protein ACI8PZ_007002 [Myxococcota bacterium]|jgi:hypothetical protein